MKNNNYGFVNSKFKIFYLVFVLSILCFSAVPARGYPIDGAENADSYSNFGLEQARKVSGSVNELIRSLLGPSFSSLTSVDVNKSFGPDLNKLIPGGTGLSFDDFINIKSFSTDDISGSIKAVAVLFIKLIVTTLSVTSEILKLVLSLLTQ